MAAHQGFRASFFFFSFSTKILVCPEHLPGKAAAKGTMCPGEEAGISAHALQARGILEEKLFCSARMTADK